MFNIQVFASVSVLKIEKIDPGDSPSDFPHLYFDDGRIGVLKNSLQKPNSLKVGQIVKVRLDTDHTIQSIRAIKNFEQPGYNSDFSRPAGLYEPTILPGLSSARAIFKRMNRKWTRDSECFNRAHIWNYEEFKRSGLKSNKVFIFFTKRYIRKYKFHWWFHAIPTVLIKHRGKVVERALDRRYATGLFK